MAAAAILNFGKMSITPDWIKIYAPNFTGIVEASNFKFGTQLGFETSLPKNNVLDQNSRGSGPGEHPKNGTPEVFLQPLKLATTNLVHKLGLAQTPANFGPKRCFLVS